MKNFLVNLSVSVITSVLNIVGFCLRQVVKFKGLDPDVSPYKKYLDLIQKSLDQNHESPYDKDFDISKYVKSPTYAKGNQRPSFKFNDKPSWQPKEEPTLQVTLPNKEILELNVANTLSSERRKKLAEKIKKASKKRVSKKVTKKVA